MVDKHFLTVSIFLCLCVGKLVLSAPTSTDWATEQHIPLPRPCAQNSNKQDTSTVDQGQVQVLPCKAFQPEVSLTLQQVFWRTSAGPVYPRSSSDPRLSILEDYGLVVWNASLTDSDDYHCISIWMDDQGGLCLKQSSVNLMVKRHALEDADDICGQAGPGVPTPHRVPWMAMLFSTASMTPICGGALITNYWVLSAAHCYDEYDGNFEDDIVVRLGENDWTGTTFGIAKVMANIERGGVGNYNKDLVLIRLEREVEYKTWAVPNAVWPICLPKGTTVVPGEVGLMTGWGRRSLNGPPSHDLKKIRLPVRSRRECRNTIKHGHPFTRFMFCAGHGNGSADQCQGDSGGPFAVKRSGRWVLAGVVSFGEVCGGHRNRYGYYVEVGSLYSWIRNTILTNPPPAGDYTYDYY